MTLIAEVQCQVDISTCSRCLFVILFCSRAEIPFMHPTHIVYAVFALYQHKGMAFVRWGIDNLLSMAYNVIIFSDKQLWAFWVDWKAAERVGNHGAPVHILGVVCCAWLFGFEHVAMKNYGPLFT